MLICILQKQTYGETQNKSWKITSIQKICRKLKRPGTENHSKF